jgi:hypothetical protein
MIVQIWCNLTGVFANYPKQWVSNWEYHFNNITYTYTKHTTHEPKSHKCCIDTNQLGTIASCNASQIHLFIITMILLVGLCILTLNKVYKNTLIY